jgi:hypothetical protein
MSGDPDRDGDPSPHGEPDNWSDVDVDAAFAAIVAQYSQAGPEIGPWPVVEDLGTTPPPDGRSGGGSKGTPGPSSAPGGATGSASEPGQVTSSQASGVSGSGVSGSVDPGSVGPGAGESGRPGASGGRGASGSGVQGGPGGPGGAPEVGAVSASASATGSLGTPPRSGTTSPPGSPDPTGTGPTSGSTAGPAGPASRGTAGPAGPARRTDGTGEAGVGPDSRSAGDIEDRPGDIPSRPREDQPREPRTGETGQERTKDNRPGEIRPEEPPPAFGMRDLHEAGPGETSRRDRRPDGGDDLTGRSGGRHVLDPAEDSEDVDDDRFIPPDPPPLPRGDFFTTFAWVCLLGGPLFLLFAALAWRDIPGELILAGVVAFIGGFVTLVARMPHDRPDDPDDGAVV